MVSHAETLHRIRRDAEAFWILDEIHRHGTASRSSLQLLANLSRRVDKDPQQQWARAELAPNDEEPIEFSFDLRSSSATAADLAFAQPATPYPNDEVLQVARIQQRMKTEQLEAALDLIQFGSLPTERLQSERAWILWQLGREEESIAAYQRAVEVPQEAAVHASFGDLLLERNREVEAEQQYQQALKIDPRQIEALVGMGTLAQRKGDFLGSREYALAALERNDRQLTALLLLAAADLQLSRLHEGLETCERALAVDPTSVAAVTMKSLIHQELGEYGQAEELLRPLLDPQQPDPDLIGPIVLIKQSQGLWQEALDWIDRGLATTPNDVDLLMQRVEALVQLNRADEAAATLEGIQSELPEAMYVGLRAELANTQSEPEQAERILREHLSMPGIALQLWEFLIREERLEEAEQLLTEYAWTMEDLSRCGQVAAVYSAYDLAVASFHAALQKDPDNPTLLNEWAWNSMQAEAVPKEEVIDAARRAHEAASTNLEFLHTYAESLTRSRQYEVCRDLLADSVLTQSEPRLSLLLGRSLASLGQSEEALLEYERCQQLLQRSSSAEWADTQAELNRQIAELQAGSLE